VRIVDFAYSPAGVTVNAGDTITWTNEDAAPHTATANDGSFDTGTLDRGASGAHTFTAAGSFSYYCTIHPSMRATVTVSGDPASAAPADPAAPAASPTAPATGPAAGSGLPDTGVDVLPLALAGLTLLLAGVVLRARTGTKPR
jgi:hypothetical protein